MSKLFRYTRPALIFVMASLVSCAHAAGVDVFSPSGEVKKVRQVAVRFSEAMVALGDPREAAPFDVVCPAAGLGRWADQRNWVYDFAHDLPAGVSCSFTLKKHLLTLDGKPVTSAKPFTFNTGGPAILQSEPEQSEYSAIDENQILILALDAGATFTSMQKNVHCEIDGVSEQIPVRIILGMLRTKILDMNPYFMTRYLSTSAKYDDGSHTFVSGLNEQGGDRENYLKLRDSLDSPVALVQCQRAFPANAVVRLVWGKGIVSAIGGIASTQDQVLTFRTRPPFEAKFSCERVNEKADCIPVLSPHLSLTAPVKLEQAQRIKLVAANGKTYRPTFSEYDKKEGTTQWLNFPAPLPENSQFKIVLPPDFSDDAGRKLSNAANFPLPVRTDENPPLAKFAAGFGILELNASTNLPPLLPVTLRNVEAGLASQLAHAPIVGKTMHDEQEMSVIGWLRKLYAIENGYGEDAAGKKSIFAAGGATQSFTLPKVLGDKAFEVVGIPLPQPGFYVVELASPRLGAALLGEARPYYAQAATLVTNLAVHFKLGRESSLVWVTRLDTGKPVAQASVAVRDCAGKIYARGHTDAQGRLPIQQTLPKINDLPGCMNDYDHQYFVSARLDNDFSFVFSGWDDDIALWRFNAFEGDWNEPEVSHAILDRSLLRTGETVHMKLLTRRKASAGFQFPAAPNQPGRIILQHQGSDDKFELPVAWDTRGTAALDWAIPPDAKQGIYQIQLPGPDSYNGITLGEFRVASFRVPSMRAIVQAADTALVNAAQAAVNVQVNYLAGGGASGLPVKLRGQLSPKPVSFADYEDFTFANGSLNTGMQKQVGTAWGDGGISDSGSEHSLMLTTQEFALDMAGAGRGVFTKLPKANVPQDILAELEYRDPNGETLTAATHIALWPSQLIVGIKPEGWMATADHLKFHALVLDINGQPQAGQKVVVNALQREYFSHRKRLFGGFYAFDNQSEIKAAGELCRGLTDAGGLLICDVKAPVKGNLILQAETLDALGNRSSANREIWVAGNDDWWFDAADNDRIDLLPEKKRFEPGEQARLQLRIPYKEADVLVTVEREGVLDSFVTHITRADPTIMVPIKGSYAPNVFISALAVRGRNNAVQATALIDLGKPSFKMGLAEINVGWAGHELKVKVSADKTTYRVREKATVTVDVKLADGSNPPRDSEVTLVAVDEGLLELKPNDSWKLLEAMMARRGIEVATSTAQMQIIGKRHFGRKALAAGGDGASSKSARELFDTLLFWQARVKLDENGHATATIPLNDSLSSFRIVAVAEGGMDRFGTGATSIASTQELMLFSGLPTVVREQDQFRANFTVRNAGDRAIEALVTAQADGIAALAPLHLTLGAGESRNVGWDVEVPLAREALQWEVSIKEDGSDDNGDRIKLTQKVIAAVPVRTLQATLVQLDAPQSIEVKLPEGAIAGRGGVKVTLRKRLGDGLGGVQEYMSRYPYNCLEQQTSQAVALQDEARWKGLMRVLPTYLDGNGLAKYWPVMRQGDDTLTAYLLAVADEAGYAIPTTLQNRMRDGLTGFVEGRVLRHSALPTSDLNIRKLAAIAALARTGEVQSQWLDSISIEPNLWPTSALLDWLSILQTKPEISANAAQQIEHAQQILRSRLNFQGTTMGFSTERSDALWWLMVDGDVNANRALMALLDEPQWQPDVPRLVRGALGRQQRGHWSTTVANAWGVLAMKKFSAKFEAQPVTGSASAELGAARLVTDWSGETTRAQQLLAWPAATAPLNLSHNGDGKPWATVQSLAALPLKQPLFSGYHITRRLFAINQQTSGEWHKGDVVRVRLEVDAQTDMAWVVVNDPIPSGATILGSGLGGDSQLFVQGEKKPGRVWPAYEEKTADSFRAYYRFVPKGSFMVEYTLRLNNEGTFQLPVTRAEAMYAPEIFGELPNGDWMVKP